MQTPVLGIAAFSGTGKTTLLKKLIPCLVADGLRLGLVKHTHHRFRLDPPGVTKLDLPAAQVLAVSSQRSAIVRHHPHQQLWDHLQRLDGQPLDLILVEGYKRLPLPKIELHRPALGHGLICDEDPRVLAVASDVILPGVQLPQLDLNDTRAIANFIHDRRGQLLSLLESEPPPQ